MYIYGGDGGVPPRLLNFCINGSEQSARRFDFSQGDHWVGGWAGHNSSEGRGTLDVSHWCRELIPFQRTKLDKGLAPPVTHSPSWFDEGLRKHEVLHPLNPGSTVVSLCTSSSTMDISTISPYRVWYSWVAHNIPDYHKFAKIQKPSSNSRLQEGDKKQVPQFCRTNEPHCNLCSAYVIKEKFTVEQATKAQKGSRGVALLFL